MKGPQISSQVLNDFQTKVQNLFAGYRSTLAYVVYSSLGWVN